MAYLAFLNDSLFFQSNSTLDELMLTSAKITKKAGESGSFTFVCPPENIAYTEFHRLIDYIDVYRDDDLIFSGRVYSIKETFDTQLEIRCEGLLAVLNDSIIRPFINDTTVTALVTELLDQHNSQVSSNKQVSVGSITISDASTVAYRDYQEYKTTIDRINDLVDTFGGYISVTKTASGLVFDWLEEYTDASAQTIDFGTNLLNVTQEENSADIITVLIPLGGELEDEDGIMTNARLTVASVNNGLDYITADAEYIEQYGTIYGTKTWDDVTTSAALLAKGQAYLNSVLQGKVIITASAVDLSDAGYDVESFGVGQTIQVTSEEHGISGIWFECTEQNLDLLNPANNKLTLGSTEYGYIRLKRRSDESILSGIINANYLLNESLRSVNQDLVYRISTYESTIEQLPDSISASVLQTVANQYGTTIETLQSELELLSDSFTIWFGENGTINTWFEFDSDYFKIRKSGSSVYSRQDNDSYEFCDSSGNTLLELDEDGLTAPTANVSGQLKFLSGTTSQWAIRKGAYISQVGGVNLNDVWIGD